MIKRGDLPDPRDLFGFDGRSGPDAHAMLGFSVTLRAVAERQPGAGGAFAGLLAAYEDAVCPRPRRQGFPVPPPMPGDGEDPPRPEEVLGFARHLVTIAPQMQSAALRIALVAKAEDLIRGVREAEAESLVR